MLNAIIARDLAASAIDTALVFAPRSVCIDNALAFYRRGTEARRDGDLGRATALYRLVVIACGRALGQPMSERQLRDYFAAAAQLSDAEIGVAA